MKIGFLSSLICYQNAETAWSLYRIFDYRFRLPRYINIARQSVYTLPSFVQCADPVLDVELLAGLSLHALIYLHTMTFLGIYPVVA